MPRCGPKSSAPTRSWSRAGRTAISTARSSIPSRAICSARWASIRRWSSAATTVGRASGAVPIRVYRVGGSLPTAVREVLADLPFGAAMQESGRGGPPDQRRDRPIFLHRAAERRARVHRADRAGVLPRPATPSSSAASSATGPSRRWSLPSAIRREGVQVDAVMLSRAEVGSLFGYARSYFHVDLPVVSAAITLLRSFMPRKSIDELYTVLGPRQAGQDRALSSPCSGIWRRPSTVSCTRRASAAW